MRSLITVFTSALVFSTSVACHKTAETTPRPTKDPSKDPFLRENENPDIWAPVIQEEVWHDQPLNDFSFSFNTFSANADADLVGNSDASTKLEVDANIDTNSEVETYSILSMDEAEAKLQKRTPFSIHKKAKPGYSCPKSSKSPHKRKFISKVKVTKNLATACEKYRSRKFWKSYPKRFYAMGNHVSGFYYQWPLGHKSKSAKKTSRHRIVMNDKCDLVGVFSLQKIKKKKCFVQCNEAWE